MAIDKKLLEIIVCPKCKGEIVINLDMVTVLCQNCRLGFPICDDIPVMIIDEAVEIDG